MSEYAQKTAEMVNMLPESEQTLAYELVRRIVLAWDPDFTKLTPAEAAELHDAENDRANAISLDDLMAEFKKN